jgi:heme-degrading monooxygenase HmoA
MAPELISYSEWESEAAIKAYRNSEAQKEIVQHACALKRAKRAVRGGVSKRSP